MAVAAGLLMLTVAADQTVANLGLLDPTVSTESANGSNNTTPPTPPPEPLLPPDEPQRPVDPGTVTDGWDDSTLAPSNVSLPQDVVARNSENGTEYDTAYGNFLLNNSSPSFVEVISPGPNPQKIGESVFLVLYEGLLLSPGNEIADDTNTSELSVSYSLYSSALLMGNMTVDYLFYSDRNKITISFSPSVGSPDQYQIVWLTFTNWDVVDTAFPDDIDQRFEDLRGYYGTILDTLYNIGTVAIPGAIIRQERVPGAGLGGPSVRMDASDAATDFAASYAGHLSF